jgi:hypothetical protein
MSIRQTRGDLARLPDRVCFGYPLDVDDEPEHLLLARAEL